MRQWRRLPCRPSVKPVAIFHTDNIKLAHNNSHPVIDKMTTGTDKQNNVFNFP